VVININSGASNESLGGAIKLTGGITSDQVFINFLGNGHLSSGSTNNAAVNATIVAPNMLVNLDSVVINGRLFGGLAQQDFSTVSNFILNQPAVASVPEPASLLLLTIGMVGGALSFHYRGRLVRRRGVSSAQPQVAQE
jgi:hypothetical protein